MNLNDALDTIYAVDAERGTEGVRSVHPAQRCRITQSASADEWYPHMSAMGEPAIYCVWCHYAPHLHRP